MRVAGMGVVLAHDLEIPETNNLGSSSSHRWVPAVLGILLVLAGGFVGIWQGAESPSRQQVALGGMGWSLLQMVQIAVWSRRSPRSTGLRWWVVTHLTGLLYVLAFMTGGVCSPVLILGVLLPNAVAFFAPVRHVLAYVAGMVALDLTLFASYRVLGMETDPVGAVWSLVLLGVATVGSAAVALAQLNDVRRLVSRLENEVVLREEAAELAAEQTERARRSAEAKSRFLAAMSHELRTPMNGIVGFARMLEEARLPRQEQEWAGIVRSSSEALLRVLNDVLDFSKLEEGQLQLAPTDVALHRLFRETMALFQVVSDDKEIRLDTRIQPGVPELGHIDGHRLRQVLLNLIGNAVKFTDAGGVTLVASARPDGDAVSLRIEVHDTGVGISPDQIGRLFERFTQGDSTTSRRFGGTGLGLAICKQLVEAMGGRMGARSALGAGSVFWFEVVVEDAREDTMGVEHDEVMNRGLDILLAEDNFVNQRLACAMLERAGHRVVVAHDGDQAVEAVRVRSFDLVLMDLHMPRLDGEEAARAIREMGRYVPIVALTASVLDEDRRRCREAGMDGFLEKPIQPDALYAEIVRVLAKSGTFSVPSKRVAE